MMRNLLQTLMIQKLTSASPPGPHDMGHTDVTAECGEFSLLLFEMGYANHP